VESESEIRDSAHLCITALIVRVPAPAHPDMENYILTFVRGSGSVWVHLNTILKVQFWFRFTEVKFCWFRFGSASPKWNGSFGFTVRVPVRFDILILIAWHPVWTFFFSAKQLLCNNFSLIMQRQCSDWILVSFCVIAA